MTFPIPGPRPGIVRVRPTTLLRAAVIATLAAMVAVPARAADPETAMVSRTSGGDPADAYSYEPSISEDGRFVAFTSEAENLGGRAGYWNVFLRDRDTGETTLVSHVGGEPADGNSYQAAISGNGRYVAFASDATDLGGGGGYWHVYVYDHTTGEIRTVTVQADGNSYAPSISRTGRFVALYTDAQNLSRTRATLNVYVHDRDSGRIRLASKSSGGRAANGNSYEPAISANGRVVGFTSRATKLASTRATWYVFAHNRRTRKTVLVSRNTRRRAANGSSYEPSLSATGRFVAFYSGADNLGGDPAYLNVFVRDRRHGRTRLASRTSDGAPADGDSYQPSISADGRSVAFSSVADNLGGMTGEWDVFVRDRPAKDTSLISQGSDGTPGDDISWRPSISGDGLFVAFESYAPNMGAEGGLSHLFVRGPLG